VKTDVVNHVKREEKEITYQKKKGCGKTFKKKQLIVVNHEKKIDITKTKMRRKKI